MRDAIIEMVRQYQAAVARNAAAINHWQKHPEDPDAKKAMDDSEIAIRFYCYELMTVKLPPQLTPEAAAAPPHVVRLPPDLRTVGLTVPRDAADGAAPPKAATLAEVLAAAKPQTVQSAAPRLKMRPPQRLRDKIARAGLRMVLRALKLDPSPFEQVRRE